MGRFFNVYLEFLKYFSETSLRKRFGSQFSMICDWLVNDFVRRSSRRIYAFTLYARLLKFQKTQDGFA